MAFAARTALHDGLAFLGCVAGTQWAMNEVPNAQLISGFDFTSHDVAMIRAHIRAFSEQIGIDTVQQARFATAVSEIARNAADHAGGGSLRFLIGDSPASSRQCLVAVVSDTGPGLPDPDAALAGAARPDGRPAHGLVGAKRLSDRFHVASAAGAGTAVTLEMDLPRKARRLSGEELASLQDTLEARRVRSPYEVLADQNKELLAVHQQLREKQAALEHADERKNRFVTTLAHELRSPLATIEMSSDILRRKKDIAPEEVIRRAEVIARQAGQIARLVEDLVDVARISEGKVDLRLEAFDLNELVRRAVETTGAAVAAKDHDLSLDLAAGSVWVMADLGRMVQVIANLVQNAARYTPPAGDIRVSTRIEAETAIVEVADSGIGIPEGLLPHIFEMFVQGDPGRVSEGGLGIGLTLVKRLVFEHGREVAVQSPGAGRGSRFTVSLPLAQHG
jgi:signal transduction histidine kinase